MSDTKELIEQWRQLSAEGRQLRAQLDAKRKEWDEADSAQADEVSKWDSQKLQMQTALQESVKVVTNGEAQAKAKLEEANQLKAKALERRERNALQRPTIAEKKQQVEMMIQERNIVDATVSETLQEFRSHRAQTLEHLQRYEAKLTEKLMADRTAHQEKMEASKQRQAQLRAEMEQDEKDWQKEVITRRWRTHQEARGHATGFLEQVQELKSVASTLRSSPPQAIDAGFTQEINMLRNAIWCR